MQMVQLCAGRLLMRQIGRVCDTLKSILEANLCTLHNTHVLHIIYCDTLKSILDADHDKVDMLVHCAQLAPGSPFENYFANNCKSQIEGANIYNFCIPDGNLQYIALRNCAIGLLS